jgi:sec-independent protein translocase protein TatB
MEILGIGASELLFIVIIALIVLGPRDMQKAGRTIGKWMRDLVTSESWKVFQQTSNELRKLPSQMMRDANEEVEKFKRDIKADNDLEKLTKKNPARSVSIDSPPASKSTPDSTPSDEQENTILPPAQEPPTDESADSRKHD